MHEPMRVRVFCCDLIRKAIYGVPPGVRAPGGVDAKRLNEAYSDEFKRRVYDLLIAESVRAAEAGCYAVADATFTSSDNRRRIQEAAERAAVPLFCFWCVAPADIIRQRVGDRAANRSDLFSDGDGKELDRQFGLGLETVPHGWREICTDRSADLTCREVLDVVGRHWQSGS